MLPIFRQIKIFSKSVVFTVGVFYLLNFLFDGKINQYFSLNPSILLSDFEYWRLFTFPLAYSSNEAFFLFLATFIFLSENLEDILRQTFYPMLLMLLTLLQGVIMTLLYWRQDVEIAGIEGISFFVIVFFLILSPKSKITFFDFKPISSLLFSLIIIFIWSIAKIIAIYNHGFAEVDISVAAAGFGIISGIMTSLQFKYVRNSKHKQYIDASEKLRIPKAEEVSYALSSAKEIRNYNSDNTDDNYLDDEYESPILTDNPTENEETLNLILDKINEKGASSLLPSEIKFLKDYSHKL